MSEKGGRHCVACQQREVVIVLHVSKGRSSLCCMSAKVGRHSVAGPVTGRPQRCMSSKGLKANAFVFVFVYIRYIRNSIRKPT